MEEFYICRPGTKPPQSCIEGETILTKVFRNVRDAVFNNEFYISALREAHREISGLYPYWQLIQASLAYELTIIGVGFVKDGATDPLHSYHTMDFPLTPKTIQQAPRPAHIQDNSSFPPKVELAVYLDFQVHNPLFPKPQPKDYPKMAELTQITSPITIKPKPGQVFVDATSSQSNESKLSTLTVSTTLMAPPLPRLPATIKTEQPDEDNEVTILSSTTETDSERRRRKKEKAKRQREKMLSYVLEHLEKRQSDSSSSQPPSRIKPPPNLHDRTTTMIPTRRCKSPEPALYAAARSLTPPHSSSRASSSHSEHEFSSHTKAWLEDRAANQQQL